MQTIARKSNVDRVERAEVIIVRSYFGAGTSEDPGRTITEVYALDGELIARVDLHGANA